MILTVGLSSAKAEANLCLNAFREDSAHLQKAGRNRSLATRYTHSRDEYLSQRKLGISVDKIELQLTEQINLNIARMASELTQIRFHTADSKLTVFEKRRSQLLKSFQKLTGKPSGRFNYLDYLDLASQYAMLMGKAHNLPGGEPHKDTTDYMRSVFANAKGFRRDLEAVLSRLPDQFAIPEFGPLDDLADFNELIGEDIWVLGLANHVQDVDGKPGAPDWYFYHDINHLMLRASASSRYSAMQTDKNYYSDFREWKASRNLNETEGILANIFWFFAHHESSAPLNRESLLHFIDHVSDFQLHEIYNDRIRYSGKLDSLRYAEMAEFLTSLRGFAETHQVPKIQLFHGDAASDFIEVNGGFYLIKNGTYRFVSDDGNQSTVVSLFDPSHAAILKRQIGEARFNQIKSAPNRETLAMTELKKSRKLISKPSSAFTSVDYNELAQDLISAARINSSLTKLSRTPSKIFSLQEFIDGLTTLSREGLLIEPPLSGKSLATLASSLNQSSSLSLNHRLFVDVVIAVRFSESETLLVPMGLMFREAEQASLHADIREIVDSTFQDLKLRKLGIFGEVVHSSGGALLIEKRKPEPWLRYLELSREDYRRGGYEELSSLPNNNLIRTLPLP